MNGKYKDKIFAFFRSPGQLSGKYHHTEGFYASHIRMIAMVIAVNHTNLSTKHFFLELE